jgi:5-methyltetrahydrofolate corrinoid/iron sulfur protein methyltransferase
MKIIGEKINGAIPSTAKAIEDRDADYIADLAKRQTEAGADYLDVCAGTTPEKEYDALSWLLEVVQGASDVPICLDSPDPDMIVKTMGQVDHPGILNSISAEHSKCDVLLPVLERHPEWSVMALCSGNEGVSETCEQKMGVAAGIMEQVAAHGIANERVFLDPLVLAASAVEGSAVEFCKAIDAAHGKWPGINVAAAISNVSFGTPARALLNRVFLALCLEHGLDAAIMDPTSREMIGTAYAADLLMARDRHGRKYNGAYRKGKIGPVKKK